MSDLLEDAFVALREEEQGASDRAAATRRAVLLAASARRRKRLVVLRLVVPLAAVLAVSSAWAAATGRLPRAFAVAASLLFGEHDRESAREPLARSSSSGTASAPLPDTSAIVAEPSVAIDDLPAAPAPSAIASARKVTRPIDDAGDREDALYRVAHEAHFVAKDSARALAGWDAYLGAFPRGRFAPEARYNRGISLVRLGRTSEARAALQPFADGAFGDYRRREARELLDALE